MSLKAGAGLWGDVQFKCETCVLSIYRLFEADLCHPTWIFRQGFAQQNSVSVQRDDWELHRAWGRCRTGTSFSCGLPRTFTARAVGEFLQVVGWEGKSWHFVGLQDSWVSEELAGFV